VILLVVKAGKSNFPVIKLGTMDSLDKDVFREEKGSLIESYTKLAEILGVEGVGASR